VLRRKENTTRNTLSSIVMRPAHVVPYELRGG
jgi:hypothetical protein